MIIGYEITPTEAASVLLVFFVSMMIVITNEPLELGMSNLRRIDSHHVYRLCIVADVYVNGDGRRREHIKAYWLRDAPTSLTFNNCKLCPHCIYVFVFN
jgi:hypothetical protein